jgi:uncharacterized protein YbjT (DUF2867 family)
VCGINGPDKELGRLLYELFEGESCMPKTLVTGGNIGNYVAEGLAKKHFPVRVLVRRVKSNPHWENLGIEQVSGDFGDVPSLAPAFDGVDRFFSLSPMVENLAELGTNAVTAAKQAGVDYIVRSSAMGASENAITIGRLHREVEKAIEGSGIPYTILQPNTFMQSYLVNADTIKSTSAFYMPQGDGKVSLVDVRDIAAIAVACLTEAGHQGKKYVITGEEALSNVHIAEKLTHALAKKTTYVDVTPEQAKEAMAKSGVSPWMIQCLLELFAISKAGYVAEVSPVVKQVLKRDPISFDQFLEENDAAFRADHEIAGVA